VSLNNFVGAKPEGKFTIETPILSVNSIDLLFYALIVKLKSWTDVLKLSIG
jgi:hypothetical protein